MPSVQLRRFPLLFWLLVLLSGDALAQSPWLVTTPGGGQVAEEAVRFRSDIGEPSLEEELRRHAHQEEESASVDLSRYQLVGLSGPLRLQVGLQDISGETLILRDLRRQGFSFLAEGGPRQGAIRGFVVQTEPAAVPGDALGLSQDENRLAGVMGEISAWPDAPVQVRLTGGVLSGTRPGWERREPQQGDAWSMAAEAEVGGKLLLRGELAGSRLDPAGPWKTREGGAAVLLARYGSVLRPASTRPVEWHFGVESSTIDPGFHSMGNTSLLSDLDRVRLFGGMRRDRLSLTGTLNRERNNLDELHHRPTTESAGHSVVLAYHHLSPLASAPWFGTPRHSVSINDLTRRPKSDPAEFRYGAIDDEEHRVLYRLDFSRESWEWGVGYRRSAYRDALAPWRDADERVLELRLERRFAERLFLAPFVEVGSPDTHTLGLKGSVVLVPERLRAGWDARHSSRTLVEGGWEENSSLSAELACTLGAAAGARRSGWLLALSAYRSDWESSSYPRDREYRLFLNLRSTFSTG